MLGRLTTLERALNTTHKFGGAVIVTAHGRFSFSQKEMRDAIREWINVLYESSADNVSNITVTNCVHRKNSTASAETASEFMRSANQMYKWVNSPETPL